MFELIDTTNSSKDENQIPVSKDEQFDAYVIEVKDISVGTSEEDFTNRLKMDFGEDIDGIIFYNDQRRALVQIKNENGTN